MADIPTNARPIAATSPVRGAASTTAALPTLLALPLLMLAILTAAWGDRLAVGILPVAEAAAMTADIAEELTSREIAGIDHQLAFVESVRVAGRFALLGLAAVLALGSLGALLGYLRLPLGLRLFRLGCWTVYLTAIVVATLVFLVSGALSEIERFQFGEPWTLEMAFFTRIDWLLPLLGIAAMVGMLHVVSHRAETIARYRPAAAEPIASPGWGDVALENLRRHGRDPRFRKSVYIAFVLHVIVIVPWTFLGCRERVLLPPGEGRPQVEQVVAVQQVKKKIKRIIHSPDSPIIFLDPNIDPEEISDIDKQVDTVSQQEHKADTNLAGKLGDGDGEEGGWPEGLAGGRIPFFQLRHDRRGWEDGTQDATPAADAFLDWLRKKINDKPPVARRHEVRSVAEIGNFEPGYEPPFVYVTGGPRGFRLSNGEREILRGYIDRGGMLFGDAGHPNFLRDFQREVQRIVGKPMQDISKDDGLFRAPYPLDYPPRLFAQGGGSGAAKGVKIEGRWVAVVFPHDLNDAWYPPEADLPPDLRDKAYKMTANVVYYAITQYLQESKKFRKP